MGNSNKTDERRASSVEREDTHTNQRTPIDERRSTMFSLWLSWQELKGRKAIFCINVILIALLIALPVTLDFVSKARKTSVGTKIDYLGSPLIIVPGGIKSSDLVAARLKGRAFSVSVLNTIEKDLAPYLRGSEARLTERVSVNDMNIPIVGIDFKNTYSYLFKKFRVSDSEVVLGKVAADKLKKKMGDNVRISSNTFRVAGIIPTTGEIDDASVFMQLSVLQGMTRMEGRINEIRLYPESASSYEQLKTLLKKYTVERRTTSDERRVTNDARRTTPDGLNIIDAYRGDNAEINVDSTLIDYQKALYTVAFVLIAFCIMISTYINLDGRKGEISTVYTLGARQGIIFQLLTFRTVWITLIGSCAGHVLGLVIASFQDLQVPLRFIWSAGSFLEVVLVTVGLGVFITIPFAFYSVYKRDPVEQL